MRLFLVRHGETEYNRRKLALGRADVPLNKTGRRQAEALGRALAGEDLAAIYTSPLSRARRTAEAIAAPHGLSVEIDERLIEMDVGVMEGKPFTNVRQQFPEVIERWLGPAGPNERLPGGERLIDVCERAGEALKSFESRHDGEGVCAVSHNFVILSLLTRIMGLELANFRRLHHSVAAIARLQWQAGGPAVVSLDETSHLEGIT